VAKTPQHCPGWESFRNLKSFVCTCNQCGAKKEVFSDEFERAHSCPKCGTSIDFATCKYEAGGSTEAPR
jgi:hypothetical protein